MKIISNKPDKKVTFRKGKHYKYIHNDDYYYCVDGSEGLILINITKDIKAGRIADVNNMDFIEVEAELHIK